MDDTPEKERLLRAFTRAFDRTLPFFQKTATFQFELGKRVGYKPSNPNPEQNLRKIPITVKGQMTEITRTSAPFSLRPEESYTDDRIFSVKKTDLVHEGVQLVPDPRFSLQIDGKRWHIGQISTGDPAVFDLRISLTQPTTGE